MLGLIRTPRTPAARRARAVVGACLLNALAASHAAAQDAADPPPLRREFRGAWVATVGNIDWPSQPGLSSIRQQDELLRILDRAVQLRLNAVVLQVRPEGDALYASALEPWSEYLTGQQGRAPDPFYDPLAFAVAEAHRRGLELHAWFNPFRARSAEARWPSAPTHVTRVRPEQVRRYATQLWLEPGDADVRRRALQVILDVVRRYDVDGVHIDDYFYPYVEHDARGRKVEFPDAATYQRYRRDGGTLARDDWRRSNVDMFVHDLYRAVKAAKPRVRVGISPFGIWRPGTPPGIEGLDAFTELYADSRKWLANGWLDYVAPQLYWSLTRPKQSFTTLLAWWVGENVRGRHVWPGLYTNRVGVGQEPWPADEILQQVRLTRAEPGATGNVHFSMAALMDGRGDLASRLGAEVYHEPALVPAAGWLDAVAPPVPQAEPQMAAARADSLVLALGPGGSEASWLYVVRARYGAVWRTAVVPGQTSLYALPRDGSSASLDRVLVHAVDRIGNLSAARMIGVAPPAVIGAAGQQ